MSLKCYKYRLPFANPFQTSRHTYDYREGLILEYSTGGVQYFGEAAPLPDYSNETMEEIQQKIIELKDSISNKLSSEEPIDAVQRLYEKKRVQKPSLQFGLDSLAYQIQAHRKAVSLWNFIFPNSVPRININALGTLHSEDFLSTTGKLNGEGFQTVKFKIGIDFNLEFQRLQKIRAEFPDLTIRLDANQAWNTKEALIYSQKLESLNIEYCEEPLKKATPENFELLNRHSKLPLALDESVSHLSYWPNLLPFTSYLILKPMLLGSFKKNFETKKLADTHDNKAVFTTSLESGIGRRMVAILAAGLGSPKIAHGLGTGRLLAEDVHSDIDYISKGHYYINRDQPGIDPGKLGNVSSSLF